MSKLLILCCINIISVIYAAPLKSDAKIEEILQLDFLKKCPAVLNNNIEKHKSDGGLSHCKNVTIGNTPEQIDLTNINEFYCIGLLAADIQLCSGNRINKVPKNYDDLKTNIEKIKNIKAEKICSELKDLKLFNEIENVTNMKKWIEMLDKHLHSSACLRLCSDIEHSNTNVLCSLIYYINNNITYVTIPEKIQTTPVTVTTVPPIIKDNAQQNPTPEHKDAPLNIDATEKAKTSKIETPVVPEMTNANVKNNGPLLEAKVEAGKPSTPVVNVPSGEIIAPPVNNLPVKNLPVNNEPVNNQAVGDVDKSKKDEEAVVETTTVKPIPPVQKNDEPVGDDAKVKNIQITEESKQPPAAVNPNTVIEENQKNPAVESSSVSSTISGARDELADEYFEEVDEINKENEDQLPPQTNARKETIGILASEQDRHRIPSEDEEDMEDSNFFSYFMFVSVMFIAGYVVYHNKQKIMALLLEGRRDRNSRRRPNTASYRKLNSNLEEAVTSKCSGSASHVIY